MASREARLTGADELMYRYFSFSRAFGLSAVAPVVVMPDAENPVRMEYYFDCADGEADERRVDQIMMARSRLSNGEVMLKHSDLARGVHVALCAVEKVVLDGTEGLQKSFVHLRGKALEYMDFVNQHSTCAGVPFLRVPHLSRLAGHHDFFPESSASAILSFNEQQNIQQAGAEAGVLCAERLTGANLPRGYLQREFKNRQAYIFEREEQLRHMDTLIAVAREVYLTRGAVK